jgi:hypothetical protein
MELYTPLEIEQIQQDLPYLVEIGQWLKNFVARPHPDVGRTGPVCPFVPKGLKLNYLRLKVIRSQNLSNQQIADLVRPHLDTFLKLEPTEPEAYLHKSILLIFPDVADDDAPQVIDAIHKKLKPLFVELGVMLGEFHNRTESPGLHNSNFRPLRSPVPMLVIRPMTEADLPFLENPDEPYLRMRYLQVYLQKFGGSIKDEAKLKRLQQKLALAKNLVEEKSCKFD